MVGDILTTSGPDVSGFERADGRMIRTITVRYM
jgi:hypothetical protein